MKLYTLDYDCNLPVTQQVNIATNTDAKIGIKVKKNGDYLNLDGSTLSVVTPEVITPEPSELIGPGHKIIKSPLPFPALYALMTPLSSVVGAKVYGGASNFSVDISQDNENWSDYDWTAKMTIDYRDLDINPNIIAQCKVSQGETKWTWTGGPLSGQTTDTVPANPRSRVEINFNDTDVSAAIATNPAYFRLNCIVHEPPYHATISADEELTNGYVTFPISIGDEPSLTQDTVVVNKESIVTNCDKNSKMPPAAASVLKVFISDIIPEGMLVSPDVYMQYGSSALSADGERITGYTSDDGFLHLLIDQATYGVIAGNFGTVNGVATNPNKWYRCTTPTAWSKEWDLEHPLDYIETTKPAFIQCRWMRSYLDPQPTANDKYMFFHCSWKIEETKANFKLNVNGFKSQQGDKDYIGELPDIPTKTANLSGTYADNTEFSFDIFYK